MKPLFLLLLLFYTTAAETQTCITNTTVVDVIHATTIPAQTVVFDKGKIIAMGKTGVVKIPAGTTVIDGSGRYLVPGFVDAHVHFFQTGGLYTRPDVIDLRHFKPYATEIAWTHEHMEDFLRRYVSAGITTVIDPGSTINFLQQRDTFRAKPFAPRIYMTGPLLTTYEPDVYRGLQNEEPFYKMETDEGARKSVDAELAYHPDFIKIWYIVQGNNTDSAARASEHLVKAVIDEAHRHHLKVAVHATERIAAELAVKDGADYLVHSVDDEIIGDGFVNLLKQHQVILCPTLTVATNYSKVFAQNFHPSDIDDSLANPQTIQSLLELPEIPDTALVNRYKRRGLASLPRRAVVDSIMAVNLKKLSDAGVTIVTGTDAGNIGTLHASSYFAELGKMQEAGMTTAQILQASTINGAKCLGKDNEFGSVEKGKDATMLLLDANPLEQLSNWRKITLIINRGVVIHPATLLQDKTLQ